MINNKKKSSSRVGVSYRYITTEHLFASRKLNRFQFVNYVVDLAKRKMQDIKASGGFIDSSYILDDVFLDLEAGKE